MRHLRHTVLAALAVALCIAPVAGADDSQTGGGAVVAPAKDKWLGEIWAQIYSAPVGELGVATSGAGWDPVVFRRWARISTSTSGGRSDPVRFRR